MSKRTGSWSVPLTSFVLAVALGILAGPVSTVLGRQAGAVTCDCIAKLESVHDSLIWGGGGAGNQTVTQFSITLEPVTHLAMASKQLAGALKVTLTATAQGVSTALDTLTFTITQASGIAGNNYVGAQSLGDVWLLTIDDTNQQFSAIDQTTGNSYAGNANPLPNGFLQTSIFASTDPKLPLIIGFDDLFCTERARDLAP